MLFSCLLAALAGAEAYTAAGAKHERFTTLLARRGGHCTAIEGAWHNGGNVNDEWCVTNCAAVVPWCPPDLCSCPGGNPMPGTKKTVPAQPAKGKLVCKAVKDSDVHDGWCDTNCASDPPNCPTKKCKCEGQHLWSCAGARP